MIPVAIQQKLSETLNLQVRQARPLGGGCIHHAHRLETDKGSFFIKWNHIGQARNFEVECRGLELLASTSTLRTPQVIGFGTAGDHAFLVLEFIPSGRPANDYWADFGARLAQLHLCRDHAFGLDYDNFIGSLPQSNRRHEQWLTFFIQERLEATLRLAEAEGLADAALRSRFERLYGQLEHFFPEEPPSLIHGDLWGGNIMQADDGQAVVIDPAVYYAHREIELAFMTLFDRQPAAFYEAYESVYPLEKGWQERLDLYNLYPLMVHVNLFGTSYLASVNNILNRYL